jgi:hypothetical protein
MRALRPLWLFATRRYAGLSALLPLLLVAPAYGDEPPTLRQGLWQFERTVGGQKLLAQECVDPNEGMKRQNAVLEKSGCTFSPGQRAGKTYTFTVDCSIKPPGGAAVTVHSTSVMTVESDSAYKVEITTTGAGTSTPELLLGRRLGDCTK